jgi:outer membrane protein assembly factor BamE (lipoprotein component of BamABCDE complex)
MRGLIRLAMLMALVVAASGCGIARQVESRTAHDQLVQLQVGMERDLVLSLMGQPYTREAYGDAEFLFYETNHWAKDERKRFTPILIKDGKVAGWGQRYYSDPGEQKSKGGIGTKPR